MENWFQRVFLTALITLPLAAQAQESTNTETVLDKIVTPDMQRRHIEEDQLDTENFEIGVFYGYLSIEDFSGSWGPGLRAAYHISEDFFLEGNYGRHQAGLSSSEIGGGLPELTDKERQYSYYNLNLGYNLFPGEVFIADKWAFNSTFYLVGGAGNTTFGGAQHFTYTMGAGYKIYLTDWLDIHIDMRDHLFERELLGYTKKWTNNMQANVGLAIFF